MHLNAYLSNGNLNELSNFNFEKVDKSAYFQPWFDQTWTRTKIAPNIIKIGVQADISNGYLNPLWKLSSEKVDKSAYFQTWFDQPWKRAKIAWNIIKLRCPWLPIKWVPKYTFKTQLRESRQMCIFSTFVWPTLKEG